MENIFADCFKDSDEDEDQNDESLSDTERIAQEILENRVELVYKRCEIAWAVDHLIVKLEQKNMQDDAEMVKKYKSQIKEKLRGIEKLQEPSQIKEFIKVVAQLLHDENMVNEDKENYMLWTDHLGRLLFFAANYTFDLTTAREVDFLSSDRLCFSEHLNTIWEKEKQDRQTEAKKQWERFHLTREKQRQLYEGRRREQEAQEEESESDDEGALAETEKAMRAINIKHYQKMYRCSAEEAARLLDDAEKRFHDLQCEERPILASPPRPEVENIDLPLSTFDPDNRNNDAIQEFEILFAEIIDETMPDFETNDAADSAHANSIDEPLPKQVLFKQNVRMLRDGKEEAIPINAEDLTIDAADSAHANSIDEPLQKQVLFKQNVRMLRDGKEAAIPINAEDLVRKTQEPNTGGDFPRRDTLNGTEFEVSEREASNAEKRKFKCEGNNENTLLNKQFAKYDSDLNSGQAARNENVCLDVQMQTVPDEDITITDKISKNDVRGEISWNDLFGESSESESDESMESEETPLDLDRNVECNKQEKNKDSVLPSISCNDYEALHETMTVKEENIRMKEDEMLQRYGLDLSRLKLLDGVTISDSDLHTSDGLNSNYESSEDRHIYEFEDVSSPPESPKGILKTRTSADALFILSDMDPMLIEEDDVRRTWLVLKRVKSEEKKKVSWEKKDMWKYRLFTRREGFIRGELIDGNQSHYVDISIRTWERFMKKEVSIEGHGLVNDPYKSSKSGYMKRRILREHEGRIVPSFTEMMTADWMDERLMIRNADIFYRHDFTCDELRKKNGIRIRDGLFNEGSVARDVVILDDGILSILDHGCINASIFTYSEPHEGQDYSNWADELEHDAPPTFHPTKVCILAGIRSFVRSRKTPAEVFEDLMLNLSRLWKRMKIRRANCIERGYVDSPPIPQFYVFTLPNLRHPETNRHIQIYNVIVREMVPKAGIHIGTPVGVVDLESLLHNENSNDNIEHVYRMIERITSEELEVRWSGFSGEKRWWCADENERDSEGGEECNK